jgi:PPOX class probable F420-dependent enzyme
LVKKQSRFGKYSYKNIQTLYKYWGVDESIIIIIEKRGAMDPQILNSFTNHQYINVETFRKNGKGVKTPVWFVTDENSLAVRTEATSGKMKRMRNNPKIRVAPCDARGNLLGNWVEAHAFIVTDESESETINQMLNKKYGLFKRFFDLMQKFRGGNYGAFRISFEA